MTTRTPVGQRLGVYLPLPCAKSFILQDWNWWHCHALELAKSVLSREDWEHYSNEYTSAVLGLPKLTWEQVDTSKLIMLELELTRNLRYEHITNSDRRLQVSDVNLDYVLGNEDHDEDDDEEDYGSSWQALDMSDITSPFHPLVALSSALGGKITPLELQNSNLAEFGPVGHRSFNNHPVAEYLFLGGALETGNFTGLTETQVRVCHQMVNILLKNPDTSSFIVVNDVSALSVADLKASAAKNADDPIYNANGEDEDSDEDSDEDYDEDYDEDSDEDSDEEDDKPPPRKLAKRVIKPSKRK